jgi:MYXO-CTERM domain-containing protein
MRAQATLPALAIIFSANAAFAQQYFATISSSPYAPLTGATSLTYTNLDDGSELVTIPFPFTYYGTTFNAINVGVNGLASFANACSTTCADVEQMCSAANVCVSFSLPFVPVLFPNMTMPYNVITPFWDDLVLGADSVISWGVVGSAPSRELVIQWSQVHHTNIFAPPSMSAVNFQIRLQEMSNFVRVAYGPYLANPADNAIWAGLAGIQNGNGTQGLDPLPCDRSSTLCTFADLQMMENKVITYLAPVHADLVGDLHTQTGALPGQTIHAAVQVTNVGAVSSGSGFDVNVYLALTATQAASGRLLGTLHFAPLAAQASITSTLTAVIPAAAPLGYYTIVALIDPTHAVTMDQRPDPAAQPRFLIGYDLSASLDPIPETGPSDQISFPIRLLNLGAAVASAEYAVFLSTTQTRDLTARQIASGSAPVAAVPITTVTVRTTIPADMMPGTYYAIVVVDPNNRIMEADENNNTAVAPGTTMVRGPDIVAVSVSGDHFGFHDMPYHVTAVLKNSGFSAANAFYYAFYASDNSLITFSDHLLGEFGPITLQPGESTMIRQVVTITSSLAAGPYYLGLIANTRSNVLEETTANNVTHQRDQIIIRDPAPDFIVTSIQVPPSSPAGESLTISRIITNAGNAPSPVDYAVYLCATASIVPGRDVLLGMGSTTLQGGADDVGADIMRIPGEVPAGSYFVGYWLDPQNQVAELYKDNNIGFSLNTVTVLGSSLSILTRTFPIATLGLPYEVQLAATGGTAAYTWSITGGALPPGLSLDGARGWLSGTPTQEGLFPITLAVTDGRVSTAIQTHLLVSSQTEPLAIITRSLIPAYVNTPYQYALTAFGGVPPYTWAAHDQLPQGLSLSMDGTISGTSQAPIALTINFSVTDTAGKVSSRPIVVRVIKNDSTLRFSEDVLADGRIGEPYDQTLRVEPGTGVPPYRFELADGTLPPGLSIVPQMDGSTHVSGVPTTAGTFSFGVRVRDDVGEVDVNEFVVSIEQGQGVGFATTSLPTAIVGQPYLDETGATVHVKAVGMGSISYALIGGVLPSGLTMTSSGAFQGTPKIAGVSSFILAAKDSAGQIDVGAFGIVVKEMMPTMTSTPAPSKKGCGCSTSGSEDTRSTMVLLLVVGALVFARRRIFTFVVLGALMMPIAARAQTAIPYVISHQASPYQARSGQPVELGDVDMGSAIVGLPFPFDFYQTPYTSLQVSANGVVSFDLTADLSSGFNTALPFMDPSSPGNIIAPLWMDLIVGGVTFSVEGAAPNRVAIIQWNDAQVSMIPSGTTSFQLWLFEGIGGRFEVHYSAINGVVPTAWSATTGFQNASATDGDYLLACGAACDGTALNAAGGTVYRAIQDGGVDIAATAVSGPMVIFPGIRFPVRVGIASYHDAAIGPFTYQIDFMPAGDTVAHNPIFTSQPVTLGPFQTITSTVMAVVPLTTAPGHYLIALSVDPSRAIMDVNTSNNVLIGAQDVRVMNRRPNFTVTSVKVAPPLVVAPGSMIDVSVTAANDGNLDGTAGLGVYISRQGVITPDDIQIGSSTLTLTMQQTTTRAIMAQLPAGLSPGLYWIGAIIDPHNRVPELNELDNAATSTSPITLADSTLSVSTTVLPRGYVGVDYSVFLQAAGGNGGYIWSVLGGSVPQGLTLITTTGELRGMPMSSGTFMLSVGVTSGSLTAMGNLQVAIDPVMAGLTIVTRELLPGIIESAYPPADPGTAIDQQQHVVAVGNMGPVSFTLDSTAPPGLQLQMDGYLYGTPTTPGVFQIAVRAMDARQSVTRTIPLTVGEPDKLTLISAVMPDAALGEEYQYQLRTIGVPRTATASLMFTGNDQLPPGLAVGSTGLVSGVPTRAGAFDFVVKAVETSTPSQSDSAMFHLTVVPNVGFRIKPTTLPEAIAGVPYDQVLQAELAGGMVTPPIDWRVQGQLPDGLMSQVQTDMTTNVQSLAITGVPKAAGYATVLVSATDASGEYAQLPITVYVVPGSPAAMKAAKKGCGCTEAEDGSGLAPITVLILLGGFLAWGRRNGSPKGPRGR